PDPHGELPDGRGAVPAVLGDAQGEVPAVGPGVVEGHRRLPGTVLAVPPDQLPGGGRHLDVAPALAGVRSGVRAATGVRGRVTAPDRLPGWGRGPRLGRALDGELGHLGVAALGAATLEDLDRTEQDDGEERQAERVL